MTASNTQWMTRHTTADLSAKPWRFVKTTNADLALCGAGELMCGALGSDVASGAVTAKDLGVQIGPIVKVMAGAALTAGTLVMSDADGKAVTATANKYAAGQALRDGVADGDLIDVQLDIAWYEA